MTKADSLWVKWLQSYYLKHQDIMSMPVPAQASFLFKKILELRTLVAGTEEWTQQCLEEKYCMAHVYDIIRPPAEKVQWRELILNNISTPRAKFVLWIALHGRLATKKRLLQFNIDLDPFFVLCGSSEEDLDHLLFECPYSHSILSTI
ncbi:hypothetical protein OROGR_008978 [Orobanche gracilis]